jgi:E3 ubiquitin-protein ligase HECTD2
MPSLALGKLLSSNNAKANDSHDSSSKKQRRRSLSEKRVTDSAQLGKSFTPQNTDRFASDSYFITAKRRTPKLDENFNDTDDYGFPVMDGLHLQQIADDMQELGRTILKGRCRTCNRSFQAPAMMVWRCDQCHTANGITSAASRDLDRPVKPLSTTRTQERIDQMIEDGLRRLDEMKPDTLEVPGVSNGQETQDRPQRRSTLGSSKSGHVSQRRGSAPDSPRPSLHQRTVSRDGRPSMDGRPPQSMRRKSPGAISFQGLRGTRPASQNSPPLNGLIYVSNPEPPSPFWNGTSDSPKSHPDPQPRRSRIEITRDPFQPVMDFLAESLRRQSLNISFSTIRGHRHGYSATDHARGNENGSQDIRCSTPPPQISRMDHKDLMIGDVYDVASSLVTENSSPSKRHASKIDPLAPRLVSPGSPHIDWKSLNRWYDIVLGIGLAKKDGRANGAGDNVDTNIKNTNPKKIQVLEDLGHVVRGQFLELIEQLLISPQQAPMDPQDIRYLLVLLTNPLLINPKSYPVRNSRRTRSGTIPSSSDLSTSSHRQPSPSRNSQRPSYASKRTRVLSLILGAIANLPTDCHGYIIQWLSRYPEDTFRRHIDVLLAFINDRVAGKNAAEKSSRKPLTPSTYNGIAASQMFAYVLQADVIPVKDDKHEDWQLRSACKVLQLFVRANDIYQSKSTINRLHSSSTTRRRPFVKQLIPTEHFYISQLDSEDKLDAPQDFWDWEKKEPGFQLTQFPFLLTLGTKMRILEFDARKKMANKARQEFFDSLMRNTGIEKFFHLRVRRTCVIEDSLQRVSEAISSSEGEAKKALKVHFEGEEGIDAGGLRKEWFLLLVRELLDPAVGKFR